VNATRTKFRLKAGDHAAALIDLDELKRLGAQNNEYGFL
tara:strand:- start:10404 stop:10520 length:117 start_codon:yes stop_codon:yes gene_type:complete